jgi:hypothetical protein
MGGHRPEASDHPCFLEVHSMPLIIHSGTAASDLGVTGTKRDDISDVLMSSLYFENNFLGLLTVGEEFGDQLAKWDEDALNQYKITDTAGQTTGSLAMTVSAGDAAVLDGGYVLMEDLQVGNPPTVNGEQVQITGISGTSVTITRSYAGTTATSHSASAVWRVIGRPTYQNSDLGKDFSRVRLVKQNYIYRQEVNVNIDMEQIERSKSGYAPGVRDEVEYQFKQRLLEAKRTLENHLLYGYAATSGAAQGGDWSTLNGAFAWLNTQANATSSPITTAETLTDTVINNMVKNIYRNGGFSNIALAGVNTAEKISLLYADRIRLEQNDRNRGFYAQWFTPTMANPHRLVISNHMQDTSGSAALMILDISRIRLRPFRNGFFYVITAPSFRDGDAVRALMKMTLEMRNTGTDVGYSHQLHTNLSL